MPFIPTVKAQEEEADLVDPQAALRVCFSIHSS